MESLIESFSSLSVDALSHDVLYLIHVYNNNIHEINRSILLYRLKDKSPIDFYRNIVDKINLFGYANDLLELMPLIDEYMEICMEICMETMLS